MKSGLHCLFFGALRSTTVRLSVPPLRSRVNKSAPPTPIRLSHSMCPPCFLQVWALAVPVIQTLPSQYQYNFAWIIYNLQPIQSGLNCIVADLRVVAIEISQWCTFQERYQADL
ncbi:hypothetical protein K439DRAFT_1636773 [Ramaria rubella]|nr:hypothetical protein K439DRAFT_1636773 [Ramaria rubella]